MKYISYKIVSDKNLNSLYLQGLIFNTAYMIFPTQPAFDHPTKIAGSYFYKKKAKMMSSFPTFLQWQQCYHQPFLAYLYYMLVQGATGAYPTSMTIEELSQGLKRVLEKGCRHKPIKKILIGEAPPSTEKVPPICGDYFYDPNGKWPNGSPWINAPWKAIFGSKSKPVQKVDYLKDLASAGYLLLDLFPYAIQFGNKNKKYSEACVDAYGGCSNPYPINIMSCLDELKGCIDSPFSIAFGQKKFGEDILKSTCSVTAFTKWTLANGFSLNPAGPIVIQRQPPIQKGVSLYLRVCHQLGAYGPNAALMNVAGF